MRAVSILAKNPNAHAVVPAPTDQKGHEVAVNPSGSYAFCKKCYVTRRIRDKKWIWAKECRHSDRHARSLGERWHWQGHEILLEMTRWKILAERPSMVCNICKKRVWGTAGFRDPCPGEA